MEKPLEFEKDIADLIQKDRWMMRVLQLVRSLNLPDCWVGAGFIRSKVWDVMHEYSKPTPLDDVDVIYFDPSDINKSTEKRLEARLKTLDTSIPWSVKNQARMHIPNSEPPYSSSEHTVSLWPETATAIAVRLNKNNIIEFLAPHGIQDLISMTISPTPHWIQKSEAYETRLVKKNWLSKWPMLRVNHLR